MLNLRWTASHSPAAVLTSLLVLLCLSLTSAHAATIRVAQDGTGDYTSLFDGLAAAQDGDTVSVGPGEYTEARVVNPAGVDFWSMGPVYASSVSVIGDGTGVVFVGPAVPPPGLNADGVYGPGPILGVQGVSFSGITFRNLSRGVVDADYVVSVSDCRFIGNYYGVTQTGDGSSVIENSEFLGNGAGILAARPSGNRTLDIRDCVFTDNIQGMQIQSRDTTVSRCTITGGERGVLAVLGGQVVVQDCTISDTSKRGVHIFDGSAMWLYDNVFEGTMEYNVFVANGSLFGVGNALSGGSVVTLMVGDPYTIEFWGNHILNGGGLTVEAGNAPWRPRTVSLESNWWGTNDAAQIEDWIWHAPDDPVNNGLTIDYLPFYGGPVPTEASSIGQLKGKFSGN